MAVISPTSSLVPEGRRWLALIDREQWQRPPRLEQHRIGEEECFGHFVPLLTLSPEFQWSAILACIYGSSPSWLRQCLGVANERQSDRAQRPPRSG